MKVFVVSVAMLVFQYALSALASYLGLKVLLRSSCKTIKGDALNMLMTSITGELTLVTEKTG